jgi:hypothetical protein
MIDVGDIVTRDGDGDLWYDVHGTRRVAGGMLATIEVHPDFDCPFTIHRWEEPVCNLTVIHKRPDRFAAFYNSSDNDLLNE